MHSLVTHTELNTRELRASETRRSVKVCERHDFDVLQSCEFGPVKAVVHNTAGGAADEAMRLSAQVFANALSYRDNICWTAYGAHCRLAC